MDEELDFVTFQDEDGSEYELAILTYFSHEDDTYALLFDPSSTEEENAEVEVYIMRAVDEGDKTTFLPADEDKMDTLAEIAEQLMDEMRDAGEAGDGCGCGCGCTQEDCEHEHAHDCGCGCGEHNVADEEYDDGKPGFCSGE